MHFHTFALFTGLMISFTSASLIARQDSEVPACALTCIAEAPLGECAPTDNVCLCESDVFVGSVETCINESCEGQDAEEAQEFVKATCESVGVEIPY